MLNSVKPHKVHKVKKLQLSWGAATIRFTLRTALFQTPTTLVNASVHLRVFSHLSMRPHSLKCQAPSSCGQPCSWSCNRATPRAQPYEWYSSLQYESSSVSCFLSVKPAVYLKRCFCLLSIYFHKTSAGCPPQGSDLPGFAPLTSPEKCSWTAVPVCDAAAMWWSLQKIYLCMDFWAILRKRKVIHKKEQQYFQLYDLLRGHLVLKQLSGLLTLW